MNANLASLNSSFELHLQHVKKLTDLSSKSVTDQAGLQQMATDTMEEGKKIPSINRANEQKSGSIESGLWEYAGCNEYQKVNLINSLTSWE